MSRKRRHILRQVASGAMALAVFTVLLPRMAAQTPRKPQTPYEIKAVYLHKFALHTEWPKEAFADDNAPFVIGILGDDPFGKDIDIIKDKTVKGRRLVVKYFSNADEAVSCQLLFIASSEASNLAKILKALENTSVMTIAEADGFLQASGMINLLTEKKSAGTQSVGYEINLSAAQRANLKLSAELLKWAKQIKT